MNVGILKIGALADPFVAKRDGVFERHGLAVTLTEFRFGAEAVAATQSGSIDIVLAIPGTAMTAIERGIDLKAIFQNEVAKDAGPDSGSVQVLASSDIKSLADLKGKRVAVSQLHSQNTVGVQDLIKRAGVDLATVQFLELPFPSQADALKSKQIDAAVTVDPFTTQLLTSGVGRVISWNYVESLPGQPLGAWFAKSAYIKNNPAVIRGFNEAIKESIDKLRADPAGAKKDVVAFTGLSPELVANMPQIDWNYQVDPTKWQAVVEMMRANGEMRKDMKVEQIFAEEIKPYFKP